MILWFLELGNLGLVRVPWYDDSQEHRQYYMWWWDLQEKTIWETRSHCRHQLEIPKELCRTASASTLKMQGEPINRWLLVAFRLAFADAVLIGYNHFRNESVKKQLCLWKCLLTSKAMQQTAQMGVSGKPLLSAIACWQKRKHATQTGFILLHLSCT